ncbi:porin [Pseudovibrio sp. SPO723]|uniref:porin n=1 Tax=Nesiotobacter zosterae TaxID=392721 RepID=UPI0029C2E547|nr:porin [Pseudovibrio sp. SPO723]MDX5595680.1 porin [Pseudovibrio sp. SPO723]
MKLKALLLATAGVAVAGSASAADLPVVAEPVDYVQVCDAYGAGFFKIPGKDTCLKIGGRVRAQFVTDNLNSDVDYTDNSSYVRGYLYLTSMTDTEIGLIKTVTEFQSEWEQDANGNSKVDDAYIQFATHYGDFLIGRTTSQFDTFTGATDLGIVTRNFSDASVLQVAYNKSLGNGLTASLSLEDSSYRAGGANEYDVVGGLKLSQGWGFARVVGAYHQIDDIAATDEQDGYAVAGTLGINLDMLAAGDKIVFAATYADAASSYVNAENVTWDRLGYDAYSVGAGFTHYFTPELAASVDGSYLSVEDANDYTRAAVTTSLGWYPVSGLVIAGEFGWASEDDDVATYDDEYLLGTRIQYTF